MDTNGILIIASLALIVAVFAIFYTWYRTRTKKANFVVFDVKTTDLEKEIKADNKYKKDEDNFILRLDGIIKNAGNTWGHLSLDSICIEFKKEKFRPFTYEKYFEASDKYPSFKKDLSQSFLAQSHGSFHLIFSLPAEWVLTDYSRVELSIEGFSYDNRGKQHPFLHIFAHEELDNSEVWDLVDNYQFRKTKRRKQLFKRIFLQYWRPDYWILKRRRYLKMIAQEFFNVEFSELKEFDFSDNELKTISKYRAELEDKKFNCWWCNNQVTISDQKCNKCEKSLLEPFET